MRLLALLSFCGGGAVLAAQPLSLPALEAEIGGGRVPLITSLIVSQDGRIVYEHYYGTGGPDHLNNTRSATKSLTALAMGRAIADGKITGTDAKVLSFFPDLAVRERDDPIKSDIRLRDLLTMSSAFAADDSDAASPGNEDRMHEQNNWTGWGLDLPAQRNYQRDVDGFGAFRYATINAVLVGQVLQRATGVPVDRYIDEALFAPLGIKRSTFQRSPSGEVMTGGGIELRSIDLWRIGEMVLEGGKYDGKQIVPADWIQQCLTERRPQTGQLGIGYGYLFWHRIFAVGQRRESAWFMAGNGGNLVVIIPGLRAVVVITRTAYNTRGAAATSARIISDFIVPVLAARSGAK